MCFQFLLHLMAVLPYAPKAATNRTSRLTLCIWLMLIMLVYKIQLRAHSPAITYFTALVSANITFRRITYFTAWWVQILTFTGSPISQPGECRYQFSQDHLFHSLVSADINFYRITYFTAFVSADIHFYRIIFFTALVSADINFDRITFFTALVSADINYYRITYFTALVSADINYYRITYFTALVSADINYYRITYFTALVRADVMIFELLNSNKSGLTFSYKISEIRQFLGTVLRSKHTVVYKYRW